MSSPEEVCKKLYGGKWKVTSLENEFEEGRKQGALDLSKQILDITNKSNIDVVEKLLNIHRLVEDKVSKLEGEKQ